MGGFHSECPADKPGRLAIPESPCCPHPPVSAVLTKDVIVEDGGISVSTQVVFAPGSGSASANFATRLKYVRKRVPVQGNAWWGGLTSRFSSLCRSKLTEMFPIAVFGKSHLEYVTASAYLVRPGLVLCKCYALIVCCIGASAQLVKIHGSQSALLQDGV